MQKANTEVSTKEEKSKVTSKSKSKKVSDKKNKELDKLRAENQELNDKFLRLYAEFDNFKKRTSKERLELFQTAGRDTIVSLLPVVDDFERALKSMEDVDGADDLREGIELIYNKMISTLQGKGLKPIESLGKELDTDFHEAITTIPAPSDDLKGKIVDEVEKGYLLSDTVIRFAKVILGQ